MKMSWKIGDLRDKLDKIGQGHLLNFWGELTCPQRKELTRQIVGLDENLIPQLSELVRGTVNSSSQDKSNLRPADTLLLQDLQRDELRKKQALQSGEEALTQGKVAVVVVAGGQGTRLGSIRPKGLFPIGPITKRSLFQYHVEKIRALEMRYGHVIPFCIMTSEATDRETRKFFQKNKCFGKDESSIYFFVQGTLPTFSPDGKILLEKKWRISCSPDGHGGILNALNHHGVLTSMAEQGIECLYYFQVDNVLTQIADPLYLGLHRQAGADISAKTIAKRDPFENLGNIGTLDGRYCVIEYSELSEQQKTRRRSDGRLVFEQGSIALHVFRVSFLQSLIDGNRRLPYHLAFKKISCVDESGRAVEPTQPNGYKIEQFIFDAFHFAEKVMVVETERKKEFSPIKNADGNDSPITARRDLTNFFASWLHDCGVDLPFDKNGNSRVPVEISPLFADRPDMLCKKIARPLPSKDYLFE